MKFAVRPVGVVVAVYSEDPLAEALLRAVGGPGVTRRASHVEPAEDGSGWTADLTPVGGPVLEGYARRSEALKAEVAWLDENVGRLAL